MKIVAREDIDIDKWNRIVENSKIQNHILYSWAMDATAENWCAVIDGDYDFLLPIPFSVKLGVKRARQQIFSHHVDYIGDDNLFPKALDLLRKEFKEFEVRLSENKLGISDQYFQYLDLTQELQYSENAKRMIKRGAKSFTYRISDDIDSMLAFYSQNTHKKLKQPDEYLIRLKDLMKNCIEHKKGNVFSVHRGDVIVASAFFIQDKLSSIYLIGDANPEDKKNGAIYGVMDFSIQHAISKGMTCFDFGGSNVDSVAMFYKKFGAIDQRYTRFAWDKTPFWYKSIRKMKDVLNN